MAALALALYAVYGALTFGVRTLVQIRRTGSSGFHGVGGRPGSAEWLAGVGFVAALAVGFAAPLLALLDVVEPIAALDTTALNVAGVALAVAGIAAYTLGTQTRQRRAHNRPSDAKKPRISRAFS